MWDLGGGGRIYQPDEGPCKGQLTNEREDRRFCPGETVRQRLLHGEPHSVLRNYRQRPTVPLPK